VKAYVVFEHQLDLLAQGSPASRLRNSALFFLGGATTSLGTLVIAPPNQDRIFYSFFIVFIITLIAAIVLLAVWYAMHSSVTSLIVEIKAQMPPNPPVGPVSQRCHRCSASAVRGTRPGTGAPASDFCPRRREESPMSPERRLHE
jgi:hypothetical protein